MRDFDHTLAGRQLSAASAREISGTQFTDFKQEEIWVPDPQFNELALHFLY